MLFFYFSGFFSPGNIAPKRTIYLSPMALYVQTVTGGAAFAPGVLDDVNLAMYVATAVWLAFDSLLLLSPFWVPKFATCMAVRASPPASPPVVGIVKN